MKLPEKVFVYVAGDSDFEYLSAEETIEGCAEPNEKRVVGVYELKEKIEVTLEVKETVIKTKK